MKYIRNDVVRTGRVPVLALALVLAAGPAACGDGTRGGGGDDVASDTETVGGGPAGGVLVVLADREPDQLNPLTFSSNPAYHAVQLMFRPLARRDSTLSGYAPDLARAWHWEDEATLILQIRDDVRWHDGTPVTADDVAFTIERQRDPVTGSPRLADVAAVAGVTVRDSVTLAVAMERTGVYAVNALLEVVTVPRHLLEDVAPAELRNAPFGRRPVGNGPYVFRAWTAGQSLTLDVNPDQPLPRPALDRIIMRFVPDANAALTELLTGQGDLIQRVPPQLAQRVRAAPNAELHAGPRVRPAWIAFNTRRPPFDDVRVRRAILMAVDRDEIARGLFGDLGEPALSPIPDVLREHSPGVTPVPYDTAGARRLLDEAGWRPAGRDGVRQRNGTALRFEVEFISTDQTRQDVLVAMQSMLRRVGVDMVPRAYESSTWVQRLRDGEFAASFWGWGWGPGVVGPNTEMIFHSRSIPPAGPNFGAGRNPRVDALLDRLLVEPDTGRARPLWQELEQLLIDDVVYAPIYMDPELFAVSTRFENVRFRGIEWVEDVQYWYVPEGERLPRDRVR
ncbi:MAG TPA: ABC transporter substrate-binding protein [Longimicrobiales bacterium]|nr:ABC transporter substrate-binding protein [Longimicrobiales bacterium]